MADFEKSPLVFVFKQKEEERDQIDTALLLADVLHPYVTQFGPGQQKAIMQALPNELKALLTGVVGLNKENLPKGLEAKFAEITDEKRTAMQRLLMLSMGISLL